MAKIALRSSALARPIPQVLVAANWAICFEEPSVFHAHTI